MGLVSMLYSYPRQNFGSTSPLLSKYTEIVYLENNRQMLSKLYLESEYSMETNPIYTYSGCPKNMDIRNRYGYRYTKIYIFPTVSLSNGRCLARLRDIRTSYGKRGV